ncbi:unnamed protein product [Calypogeia fissa]
MSEFLSRIKARLETGQHLNAASSEETGWVRAVVASIEKERQGTQDSLKSEATPEVINGWQTDLVQRMKVVGFGSQDGKESPLNLTLSGGNSDSDDISPRSASQRLWETGTFESRIPNGFYSVVPSKNLKARFKTIPSFDELQSLGAEISTADVLVVDANEDKVLARLRELAVSSVKNTGTNSPVIIKKIADMVADFYGGPLFEAGAFKHPLDECLATSSPQLLGQIKVGMCRPRALLFKFLGDAVGLHSRLLMGLQLEAVSSSSLICANPNKHLSNIVCLNDMELLVDVTRHPGHLRPFSRKALIMYHISGAGDSDSADYDSCDSPLEPNSPLFGYPDRLDTESLDQEFLDSPGRPFQRRQPSPVPAAPIHSMMFRHPVGQEGKLSPSRSEPDLANPYRRRSRRKPMTNERAAAFSPERPVGFQQPVERSNTEGVRSFPSSPEHPQARLKPIWRVGSEEGSISSSPEHPTFRVRAPSMLGGGRRQAGDEADCNGVSSPEQSPQHLSTLEKSSPIFRRRRERSLSIDVQRDGLSVDYFRTGGEFEFPRVSSSPDIRKSRKKGGAPEVGDDVVRAVRAMNEAIKLERSRSKVSSEKQCKDAFQQDHSKAPSEMHRKDMFEHGQSRISVELRSKDASKEDQSKPSRAQQPKDAIELDQSKVSPEQPSKDALELDASKASLEQRSTDVSESLAGEQNGVSQKPLPWDCIPESRKNAVAASFQRSNREESATSSNDGNEANTLERNSDSQAALGVGSSSSENASRIAASSQSLVLTPPPWLQSPLMPFAEWNIKFEELRIGVRVGIGSFGEVFRGVWRGTEVAIKVMLEQDFTEENTADFCTEIALLSRLRHPNVILFMGACTTPPHLSMVTEYMHMGSLYSLVHTSGQGKKLSWRRRLKMLRDICRGMMSVQRMNIVHCDLKSANCLVDKHWSVKICDFGLSRLASGAHVPESTAAGTPEWMAPELLRNDPVTDKCDIFSLGVIMWELCTLKRPWEGVKPMEVVIAVAHKRARLEIPEGLLGKLIADCWTEDPVARPTYEEILTRLHECEFLQT